MDGDQAPGQPVHWPELTRKQTGDKPGDEPELERVLLQRQTLEHGAALQCDTKMESYKFYQESETHKTETGAPRNRQFRKRGQRREQ